MIGLLVSIGLSVAWVAFKFFARHGGAVNALNSASTDSRSARRRSKTATRDAARTRRANKGAAARRAKEMRR